MQGEGIGDTPAEAQEGPPLTANTGDLARALLQLSGPRLAPK
ncbi:MAG TPA: hypothetical protein VIW29_11895 [Polyangiaceae bacterium]